MDRILCWAREPIHYDEGIRIPEPSLRCDGQQPTVLSLVQFYGPYPSIWIWVSGYKARMGFLYNFWLCDSLRILFNLGPTGHNIHSFILWSLHIPFRHLICHNPVHPRLAVLALLQCIEGDFSCHFGIKCSSFCKMNVGTSCRSACSSIGHLAYASVQLGNVLLERTETTLSVYIHYVFVSIKPDRQWCFIVSWGLLIKVLQIYSHGKTWDIKGITNTMTYDAMPRSLYSFILGHFCSAGPASWCYLQQP